MHKAPHGNVLQQRQRLADCLPTPCAWALRRGARNEFVVQDAALGELEGVTIGHDGSGLRPAWHLQQVREVGVGVFPLACRSRALLVEPGPIPSRRQKRLLAS